MNQTLLPRLMQHYGLKRVLLTGARAPAALEWARALHAQGVVVYAADTLHMPLTRFSVAVSDYLHLPKPASDLNAFVRQLNAFCKRYAVDLIIPTCEEVFYLAAVQAQLCAPVFAPNFDCLRRAHCKWSFAQSQGAAPIHAPETRLISAPAQLQALGQADFSDWVFKPIWSRFAHQVLISPPRAAVAKLQPSEQSPWLMQQKAVGKEVCSYSIALNGQVLAHSLYHPKYRVGKGAGIYFDPVQDGVIADYVADFCAKTHWTGQVGFDFIVSAHGHHVLECNPRATSGVHLIWGSPSRPRQIGFAMWAFAAMRALRSRRAFVQFLKDVCSAPDAVACLRDPAPFFAQPLAMLEVVCSAIVQRKSLLDAATAGIEWNGEPIRIQGDL